MRLTRSQLLEALDNKAIELGPNYPRHLVRNSSLDVAINGHIWRTLPFDPKKPRNPGKEDPASWFAHKYNKSFTLQPGERVLGRTQPFLRVGPRHNIDVRATSTAGRLGIAVCYDAGLVDVGYCNPVTLELKNMNDFAIELEEGMVLCQLVVHEVAAPGIDYAEEGGFYGSALSIEEAMEDWHPEMMLPRPVKYEDGSRLKTPRDVERKPRPVPVFVPAAPPKVEAPARFAHRDSGRICINVVNIGSEQVQFHWEDSGRVGRRAQEVFDEEFTRVAG